MRAFCRFYNSVNDNHETVDETVDETSKLVGFAKIELGFKAQIQGFWLKHLSEHF